MPAWHPRTGSFCRNRRFKNALLLILLKRSRISRGEGTRREAGKSLTGALGSDPPWPERARGAMIVSKKKPIFSLPLSRDRSSSPSQVS